MPSPVCSIPAPLLAAPNPSQIPLLPEALQKSLLASGLEDEPPAHKAREALRPLSCLPVGCVLFNSRVHRKQYSIPPPLVCEAI